MIVLIIAAHTPLIVYFFNCLQNMSCFMVTYMAYLLAQPSGRFARPMIVLVVAASACLPPLVFTFPNTLHELCGESATHESAVLLAVWNSVLFIVLGSIVAWGTVDRRRRRATAEVELVRLSGGGQQFHM